MHRTLALALAATLLASPLLASPTDASPRDRKGGGGATTATTSGNSRGGAAVTSAKGGNVQIHRPTTGETVTVKVGPGERPAELAPGDVVMVGDGPRVEVVVQGDDGECRPVSMKPGTELTVPGAGNKKPKKGMFDRMRDRLFGADEKEWTPETPAAVTGKRG